MTEWHKCSDKLPENDRAILCYTDSNDIMTGIYAYNQFYLSDEAWQCLNNVLITHWTELPEAPHD